MKLNLRLNVLTIGVAQLLETQRQKLGFNLKVGKAEQPATDSYLDLSLKW